MIFEHTGAAGMASYLSCTLAFAACESPELQLSVRLRAVSPDTSPHKNPRTRASVEQ